MIDPIRGKLELLNPQGISDKQDKNSRTDFASMVRENIEKVNQLEKQADNLTTQFALGEIDDIHQVTIATEKAKLALNMTLGIQNRVVKAYEEVMRMQI